MPQIDRHGKAVGMKRGTLAAESRSLRQSRHAHKLDAGIMTCASLAKRTKAKPAWRSIP